MDDLPDRNEIDNILPEIIDTITNMFLEEYYEADIQQNNKKIDKVLDSAAITILDHIRWRFENVDVAGASKILYDYIKRIYDVDHVDNMLKLEFNERIDKIIQDTKRLWEK